jgi:poly [ADP-ribose] polymerase 2/3/4
VDDVPGDGTASISFVKTEPDFEYLPSALDTKTRELMEVIHARDMMNDALVAFNIDTKKLPLGSLDDAQIQKGIDVLEQIKTALSAPGSADLTALSSAFYTAIPHAFSRSQRPPVISTLEAVQACFDRLDVMSDIAATTAKLDAEEAKIKQIAKQQVPHPADQRYHSLGARLELLDRTSAEFSVIQTYLENTRGYHYHLSQLLDVWKVERNGEHTRFRFHEEITERKLLWHGTGVEVVSAILGSGLRIMPHSGGRVGRGIYLANEHSKSACYTRSAKQFACMFLCEAALGKVAEIFQDDQSLRQAPSGYDSVLARGKQTPSSYTEMLFDGKKVSVPQGLPGESGFQSSSFDQDEHLVYHESQVRLRYVITLKL